MSEEVIHRAQVIPLRLTRKQARYMARAAGTSRFAYNWALAEWKRQAKEWWDSGKVSPYPSAFALCRQFNSVKDELFPWVREVSAVVPDRAIIAVEATYRKYLAGNSRRPRFKSRHGRKSFCAAPTSREVHIEGGHIKLPRIGRLRLVGHTRWPDAAPHRCTVSQRAGRWFVSVEYKSPSEEQSVAAGFAGVDLGIKTPMVVTSGDTVAEFGHDLSERLNVERRKLRRANKRLHRRVKGSGRRYRAQQRVARIHHRMANIRADVQHKATSQIARMAGTVGVEMLAVKNLMRNGRLARSIADVGFFEIKRQLKYKADCVVEADRFFPSSKTCSACGNVKHELTLSDRTYRCGECGFECDRDVNAARNLEKMAANCAVSARGVGSSAPERKLRSSSLTMKRETHREDIS